MNIENIVENLKFKDEDFEFYPSTKEMIDIIYNDLKNKQNMYSSSEYYNKYNILDIGCGNGNFKTFFETNNKLDKIEFDKKFTLYKLQSDILYLKDNLEKYPNKEKENELIELETKFDIFKKKYNVNNYDEYMSAPKIYNYYFIEKSQILINELSLDCIFLGRDFNETTLIDKPVDIIFCNPPYSEFIDWTCKIIMEGFCKIAYLIIPERWKDNDKIKQCLEKRKVIASVIYEGNFLNAERQARAKINIIKLQYKTDNKNKENPFDLWFEDFFNQKNINNQEKNEWEQKKKEEENRQNLIENQIALNKPIDEILIELYQEEQNKMINSYKILSQLDYDILKELNVDIFVLKTGLQSKIKNLKNIYWKLLFNRLTIITDKLTQRSRNLLLDKIMSNASVDFTKDNIYSIVIWAVKNANLYYNQQIIDLFMDFTKAENIKNYKSNQKVWQKEDWRYNKDDYLHYTLDYRMIMSNYNFGFDYGKFRKDNIGIFGDIFIVAKNLGFDIENDFYCNADGVKRAIYYKNSNKSFMEYKSYKNGNFHIFFDIEFIKAFNIEASRILGWIKDKSDIVNEFDNSLNINKNDIDNYYNKSFVFKNTNVNYLTAKDDWAS